MVAAQFVAVTTLIPDGKNTGVEDRSRKSVVPDGVWRCILVGYDAPESLFARTSSPLPPEPVIRMPTIDIEVVFKLALPVSTK